MVRANAVLTPVKVTNVDLTGFIAKDFTGRFADGKMSKLGQYRLKDNYRRFYLKYVKPNKEQILKDRMHIALWSM